MSHSAAKIGEEGFPIYGEKHVRKINALRMAHSSTGVDQSAPPILNEGQVQYVTAEEMGDIPCSCYHCTIYNSEAQTCGYMGPRIPVRKFIWPKEASADVKPIEYWPVCGAANPGSPNAGAARYRDVPYRDPDHLGFGWINAPQVGCDYAGANCGGSNDGDDCDYYLTRDGIAKWDAPSGFCRVLQKTVASGDVCAAWTDDDFLDWKQGLEILRNG